MDESTINYLGDVLSVGSLAAAPDESMFTLALFQCVEITAAWIEVFKGLHLKRAACSVYSWHTCGLSRGHDGGRHWLVRMEWCPAGWLVCLPLLISPCTIKSRSSLLAPTHQGGPGKGAVKWLWCAVVWRYSCSVF